MLNDYILHTKCLQLRHTKSVLYSKLDWLAYGYLTAGIEPRTLTTNPEYTHDLDRSAMARLFYQFKSHPFVQQKNSYRFVAI